MRGELDINGIFKKMKGYGFTVTTIAANGRRAAQEKCQHRNLWETVEMLRIHNVFFFASWLSPVTPPRKKNKSLDARIVVARASVRALTK